MSTALLPRTPEGEVMASPAEVAAYDRMDHAGVNRAFADDFLDAFKDAGLGGKLRDGLNPARILDVGTGTGLIPIDIGRRPIFARVTLTDASAEMLVRAKKNVFASGLQGGFRLSEARADELPFEDGAFDAVICNSVLHHLENPAAALAEAVRVLAPGGLLFVRDLRRPEMDGEVHRLVELYAAGEEPDARDLLRASLHSAYTPEELEDLLAEAGVEHVRVESNGDRHVTLCGVPKPAGQPSPDGEAFLKDGEAG